MTARHERVILSLDDNGFSTRMAKAAAQAAALERALDDLDGAHVSTGKSTSKTTAATKNYSLETAVAEERTKRLKSSLREQAKAMLDAEAAAKGLGGANDDAAASVDRLGDSSRRAGSDIDRLSGRLAIFRDLGLTLGPSLIPIGGVAVPAVTGLANQLGFAAVAAGTAVFAFQGVGTALKAVNDAALEPTTANLEKAQAAMERLSPAGQDMVGRLQELRPHIQAMREVAQTEMFPGIIDGLDSLERLGPKVTRIISEVSGALGDIVASGAESLAGERWSGFFDFLATEARGTLTDLASTVGSVAHGLAEMWMAFQPLNHEFSSWLRDAAAGFDEWAAGLSQTQGFKEFVDYIHTNGPRVAEAAGAVGNAILQIVQAVAPLGGPSLKAIEMFADAVAMIADSDMGTPIFGAMAALAAYNRVLAITVGLQTKLSLSGGLGAAGAAGRTPAVMPVGAAGKTGRFGAMGAGLMGAASAAAPVAAGGFLANGFASGLGDKFKFKDINLANSSPLNALNALVSWDADKFSASDAIKRMLTGPDKDEGEVSYGWDQFTSKLTGSDLETTSALQERAAGTARDAAVAQGQLAAALSNSKGDVSQYNATMAAHNEAMLGAFSAETSYREAMAAAKAQADSNNAGIRGNSEAALGNRRALEQLAGAWNQQDKSVRNNNARFREARRNFVDTARAMGLSLPRARALAREFMKMPDRKTTEITAKDLATAKVKGVQRLVNKYGVTKAEAKALLADIASGKINSVQKLVNKYGMTRAQARALLHDAASGPLRGVVAMLNSVDGRTATTWVVTRHKSVGSTAGTSANPTHNADGGFHVNGVRAFADGGFGADGRYYSRTPQIVPGGANILWGEQETGWEAYISGKPGMRDRNIRVLSEAADRLGVTVQKYANGGLSQGERIRVRPVTRAGGGTVRHEITVRVVGAMDLDRAKAQIRGIAKEVTRGEIDAHDDWASTQEGD